jgi:predicted DNA-binding protein (MmcQ/YjbR family)
MRGASGGRNDAPLARLRAICMALPETVEKTSHGEPSWFAGKGKMFAMLDNHHHGAAHVSVWLPAPLGAQETLVWRNPQRYFRPPYVGPRGWVGVVLDTKPNWKLVAELVAEAYRLVAHPRLVKKLEAVRREVVS